VFNREGVGARAERGCMGGKVKDKWAWASVCRDILSRRAGIKKTGKC